MSFIIVTASERASPDAGSACSLRTFRRYDYLTVPKAKHRRCVDKDGRCYQSDVYAKRLSSRVGRALRIKRSSCETTVCWIVKKVGAARQNAASAILPLD